MRPDEKTCLVPDVTDDAFIGGRLRLLQPVGGYRAGLDAVLLAAAAPVIEGQGERVLDAGAGVGTVGLCVAARIGDAKVTLLEAVPELLRIARENVTRNGLEDRVRAIGADVLGPVAEHRAIGLLSGSFEHVLANPPYLVEGHGRPARDALRAGAHAMEAGGLECWVRFLARMMTGGGTLTLIHRADALGRVLAALEGRCGALEVLPLHPRAPEPAHRVLVRGRKASRAPLRLLPGVALHGAGHRFLPGIEAVLREGAPLEFGGGG